MNTKALSFKKVFTLSIFATCMALFTISCTSDDDAIDNPGESEDFDPYVLSLAIQATDGSFSYYTVTYDDIMSGTLTAEGQGIEQPGYYDFTMIDNTIYSIGGLDDDNVVAINKDEESQTLKLTGNVSFPNSLSDLVKADDNTLVSVTMSAASDVVTFRKFNPSTVAVLETVEIQASELTTTFGPAYSGMVVSGDHLFLSYYVSDPNTYDTPSTDQAQVAVFSYPELALEKVITDDRVGPIGGFNTKSGLVKDAAGNVYALSHSNPANGYSQSTRPSGVLKIKSGETTFDQDYFFDIENVSGGNIVYSQFLENGKAFAEINTEDRASQARWSDGPLESAIVDFENQTVDFISGVPSHGGDGRRMAAFEEDNNFYITIPEDGGIYVYQINTQNLSVTKGAKVQASFIAGLYKL